jgi:hypothetical protein
LLALAACGDPPPLTLKYTLTQQPDQLCFANIATQTPARNCSDVAMLCPAVLSVRILSPSDPTEPYVSVCQPVVGPMNLCSIAAIDLPAPAVKVPSQTLEVQVAVYADADLPRDPNDPTLPSCEPATSLAFAPDNLPVSTAPSPVIGGRAFYHPGDTTTVVALGCTDEMAIQDPKCIGANTVAVTATVNDFDTEVTVPPSLTTSLTVLFGEPQPITIGANTVYVLSSNEVKALSQTQTSPTPAWGGAVDLKLMASACLEVLEDVPQETPSVVCKQVAAGQNMVDLTGVRLAKPTLDGLLSALQRTQFPPEGLVVGIVLDYLDNPVQGATVSASAGTVRYLSDNRLQFVLGGTTNTNGIFVSTDAKFGSQFTALGPAPTNFGDGYGGLIQGKVTIVVLQYPQPHA